MRFSRHIEPIAGVGVFVMLFILALLLALMPVTAAGEDSALPPPRRFGCDLDRCKIIFAEDAEG